MTDTNHIEVLERLRAVAGGEVLLTPTDRAALDAAIQSLSARASAGEGGEETPKALRMMANALSSRASYGRTTSFHAGTPADTKGTSDLMDSAAELLRRIADNLATATQPAQAGASGGGDYSQCCDTPAYCSSVRRCTAKDATASPATCPADVRGCEGPSGGIVCKACLMAQEAEGIEWTRCVFHGAPPHGYQDWLQWTASSIKSDVFIRAATADDWTPPAHGDGEGDAWTYPNRNALIHEVCDGLRGYRFDVDPICVMAIINSIPAQVFSRMGPPVLTTRPTPEAQEARDGVPRSNDGKEQDAFEAWATSQRYDMTQHPLHWLFLNERTYAARQGWRAALEYVDAALALPAQGEG